MLLNYTTTHSTRLQQHGFIYMHTDFDMNCISKLSRNRELQQLLVVVIKNRGGEPAGGPSSSSSWSICLDKAKGWDAASLGYCPPAAAARTGLLPVAEQGRSRVCPQSRRLESAIPNLLGKRGKWVSVASGGAQQIHLLLGTTRVPSK